MSENNTPVPSSAEVFAEAFSAATGGSVESAPEPEAQIEELEDNFPSQDLDADGQEKGADSAPEGQEQELSDETENSEPNSDLSETIEEVAVKGKDGKRRNIKVDFSDRDKLKKYVQKAANAVRLQSERDALQAQVTKLEESQSAMDNLQKIVNTDGFEGLIDHLNADNGGFQAWFDSKIMKHEARQHASEDELRFLDEQEAREKLQRKLDLIEQQNLDRENKMTQEREKAELDRLASEVNPIYFKYVFDGKLGDSVAEQRYNKAMFREVTETLDQLKEEGVRITPQIIEKEFRAYAAPLLKGVNRKVRQNTKSAIDKKKAEATTHAQQQVRKGYQGNSSVDEALNGRNWAQELGKLWAKGKLK